MRWWSIVLSMLLLQAAAALELMMPAVGDDVIGVSFVTKSKPGDTLEKVARRENVGYYELIEANHRLVDLKTLKPGTRLIIPTQFILPRGPRQGIVINLSEMRLYYFYPDGHRVETIPIGIGRQGWATPTGLTYIDTKIANPTWHVPKSIQEDALARGSVLPKVVPPGPDNPLGDYAMRLGFAGYLIHGTNKPDGIGRRSSSGCIRLYPEDIKRLYELASVNTPVRIVNEAYKAGWLHGHLYLEAHEPLQESMTEQFGHASLTPMVKALIDAQQQQEAKVDWLLAEKVAKIEQGLPIKVGQRFDDSQTSS